MTEGSVPPSVDPLFQQAEQAAREGRSDAATALYLRILKLSPDHPRALNALGNRSLAEGDVAAARGYLQRAAAVDPGAAPIWLNLSFALRAAGESDAELAALERALVADPYFVVALLQKAQWLERHLRRPEAVRSYRALLDAAPPLDTLTPALRQALEHGRSLVAEEDDAIATEIAAEIGPDRSMSKRLRHSLDVLAGKRKIYVHMPAGLHIPYLPAIQFFDRSLFPWFDELEAGTAAIRDELLALTREGVPGAPYVQVAPGQPVNQWATLNHSLDWSALFVLKDGSPVEAIAERCPRTFAIVRDLPMLDIPGRGPTVMFSTLRPHTHIPPHHGVTNLRSVVHLPLIIPPAGCRFRVGSETREWREGEAWAFDDTIEHEAWNDSGETRVIMIIDAWNPLLDKEERALLRTASRVLQKFSAS